MQHSPTARATAAQPRVGASRLPPATPGNKMLRTAQGNCSLQMPGHPSATFPGKKPLPSKTSTLLGTARARHSHSNSWNIPQNRSKFSPSNSFTYHHPADSTDSTFPLFLIPKAPVGITECHKSGKNQPAKRTSRGFHLTRTNP